MTPRAAWLMTASFWGRSPATAFWRKFWTRAAKGGAGRVPASELRGRDRGRQRAAAHHRLAPADEADRPDDHHSAQHHEDIHPLVKEHCPQQHRPDQLQK